MTDTYETWIFWTATFCGFIIGVILTVMVFATRQIVVNQTQWPKQILTPAKIGPTQKPNPTSI